jgi:hypothetical protein
MRENQTLVAARSYLSSRRRAVRDRALYSFSKQ